MRHLSLHLKILIVLSLLIGLSSVGYQVFVLKIPVTKTKIESMWTVDAKIEFPVSRTLKARVFLPPENPSYKRVFEAFVPENAYGNKIEEQGYNRIATLSARQQSTNTLYYRLLVAKENTAISHQFKEGKSYREPLPLADGPERIAVQALLTEARKKSTDVETIVSQTIRLIHAENGSESSDVQILLAGNPSQEKKYQLIELVLSQARIPIERVHTIRLHSDEKQTPELWLRTFVNKEWLYFNSKTGELGLPEDRLIWWFGTDPMVEVKNNRGAQVSFTVQHSTAHTLNLLRMNDISAENPGVLDFTLYDLPLETQNQFAIMLMIPIGVLVILVLRNLIGILTLGTFTPVLIALAFRETNLFYGILLFSTITVLGLSMRSYLESLKLQMLPRLSIVLTFVVTLIALISLVSYKLGFASGLSVTLFPMVILTMTIERLSVTWEERGANETVKIALGTMLAASMAYILMNVDAIAYLMFTFPGLLLVLVAFMLVMGRYRGYRLTELWRFKALGKD